MSHLSMNNHVLPFPFLGILALNAPINGIVYMVRLFVTTTLLDQQRVSHPSISPILG